MLLTNVVAKVVILRLTDCCQKTWQLIVFHKGYDVETFSVSTYYDKVLKVLKI